MRILLILSAMVWSVLGGIACGGKAPADETPPPVPQESQGGETEVLEAPPGSVEHQDETAQTVVAEDLVEKEDEDLKAEEGEQESPWGRPESESGEPLPPRHSMSATARAAYQRGIQASRNGNLDAAQSQFERALALDAEAFKATYNLGVVADRRGDNATALQYYERTLSMQPDYERAAEGIALIHLRQNNPDQALAVVTPLAQRWQRNLHLQALKAVVLVQAGKPEEAMEAARFALQRDERFVPAMLAIVKASLRLGRKELAEAVIAQALEVDESEAELHYLKGRMLLDETGRLREALSEFRRAVQLRPDYVEARIALGNQLLSGANYEDALIQFKAAVQLSPTLVEVHLNLGDAHRANSQWSEAKSSFDRALQMRSPLPEAHFNLGLMYMTAGDAFPGLDQVGALEKAMDEFKTYRDEMGPRLPRDDPSEGYLEDLDRAVKREKKRIERDRVRQERAAARAARDAERAASEAASGDAGQTEAEGSQ